MANRQSPIANLNLNLTGEFNEFNALAALAVAQAYGLDMDKAVESLNSIKSVPGRMEILESKKGFKVVIDYAHTPDSLELVYQTLREQIANRKSQIETDNKQFAISHKLICVLGAAGGGRDKWKRPEFGKIAEQYCDEIILTDEDPYDENPEEIIKQIAFGFQTPDSKLQKILDRKEAIKAALSLATAGDTVVITGKGSETSMAVAGGKKIQWSDKEIVMSLLTE